MVHVERLFYGYGSWLLKYRGFMGLPLLTFCSKLAPNRIYDFFSEWMPNGGRTSPPSENASPISGKKSLHFHSHFLSNTSQLSLGTQIVLIDRYGDKSIVS